MSKIMKCFYPTEYATSSYDIDFQRLYREGVRGIIFDIDNTLVPHDYPADERSMKLTRELKDMGFGICLLSNNRKTRVESFAGKVGVPFICGAAKPRKKNYRKAMEIMGTTDADTVFIGDQLLTDIWGANRTGIRSVLVEPLRRSEAFQIVLKRKLERIIIPMKKRIPKDKRKKNDICDQNI